MNLYCSKIYVFILLVVCRLVSGLSPLFVSRKVKKKFPFEGVGKRWVEKGVSYSMDFSGGILLATCFIHMIPEVRNNLVHKMGDRYTFPYAETLVCIGFFTVYVIEEIVRHILEDKSWHHHHEKEKSDVLIAVKKAESPFTDVKLNNGRETIDNGDSANHIQLVSTNNKTLAAEMNVMVKEDTIECNNNTKNMNGNNLKHFLLVSALSFHSVMEGLALGLATSLQDLWYLFLAVMAHECTILLCVGIELVANCAKTSTIIKYMAVLALVSPAGGVAGTLITLFTYNAKSDSTSPMEMSLVSILQGLAAGTILYVTFFEVLNNHKHHHHQVGHRTPHNHQHSESDLPKLAFIAMGFAFMILLEMTSGHGKAHLEGGHHHHHHHHHNNDTFLTNNSSKHLH